MALAWLRDVRSRRSKEWRPRTAGRGEDTARASRPSSIPRALCGVALSRRYTRHRPLHDRPRSPRPRSLVGEAPHLPPGVLRCLLARARHREGSARRGLRAWIEQARCARASSPRYLACYKTYVQGVPFLRRRARDRAPRLVSRRGPRRRSLRRRRPGRSRGRSPRARPVHRLGLPLRDPRGDAFSRRHGGRQRRYLARCARAVAAH